MSEETNPHTLQGSGAWSDEVKPVMHEARHYSMGSDPIKIFQNEPSVLSNKVIRRFQFDTSIRANKLNIRRLTRSSVYRQQWKFSPQAQPYTSSNGVRRLRFVLLFLSNTELGLLPLQKEINNFMVTISALFSSKRNNRFLGYRKDKL